MHELSIAHSILSIAEKAVPADNTGVVSGISLQIGELSGIEIDALEFAFSIIKRDTLFENAELNIQLIKGEAECLECNKLFFLNSYGTSCPGCKSYSMQILKGKEMKVLNITVEE
jgi:hydrogenase nickel incorporation protein HypA/HybF